MTVSVTAPADTAAPAASSRRRPSPLVVAIVVAAALIGAALRAWYLTHSAVNSDEAIVGLMAEQILRGHFYVFYWGQVYGGAEPYAAAVLVGIFGRSGIALEATATILSLFAAVVTWRVALRLTTDRRVAALAGALTWVAPAVAVELSTLEYGFRGVTLLTGLLALLAALRILDGRRRAADWAGLGLAAGISWWSSPEAVYYLFPAFLVLVGALVRDRRSAVRGVAVGAVAFVVGAGPWLAANLQHGFESLHESKFSTGVQPENFHQRLVQFLHLSAPIELNLKQWSSGLRVFGAPGASVAARIGWDVLAAAVIAVLLAALVVSAVRPGRTRAIAAAVVFFPLIYAASPATWYWQDGRYAVYLGPLLALLLAGAIGPGRLGRALRPGRWGAAAMGTVVVVSGALTCLVFGDRGVDPGAGASTLSAYFSGWGVQPAQYASGAHRLAADGLRRGFARYWVAYQVDFLGGVDYTTVGNDVDRSARINRIARSGPDRAWLFDSTFGGPAGANLPGLEAQLHQMHVGYRVVQAGPYTAVVPDRHLSPERQLGETHVP